MENRDETGSQDQKRKGEQTRGKTRRDAEETDGKLRIKGMEKKRQHVKKDHATKRGNVKI